MADDRQESRAMTHKFYVAPDSYGADHIEDGYLTDGDSERDAIESYVESHLADLDYPEKITMLCRDRCGGTVSRWDVFVHSLPQAHAIMRTDEAL